MSGLTGTGVDDLLDQLGNELAGRAAAAGLATRERHRVAIRRAENALSSAVSLLSDGPDCYDVAAEEIRHAIRGLESLVGRVDVEHLLDEIFASFCLGK